MIPNRLLTANLSEVIATKRFPGITWWNRLEGRPRADDFDRALRAEVRDALWMLTRQWQVGEFQGDDAGSPILTKVRLETTRFQRYQSASGPAEEYDQETPLEARVEPMPVPLVLKGHEVSLDIRLLTGRHWLKLITPLAADAAGEFVDEYPIHSPQPQQVADAPTCAHAEAWSNFAAVVAGNRRMDGVKFYLHLTGGGNVADEIDALVGLESQAGEIGQIFVKWFEKLLYQPATASAWLPDRLEYQFSISTPRGQAEKVLAADEYFQGHLDWYNLDFDQSRNSLGEPEENPESAEVTTITTLPTQVTFNGMPNTRWWAFEDSRTNFGDIKPDTTDLAKLMLIEFGLIYANDWFQVPFTVPAGSVVNIRGMAVTNVFGERTWIEGAGRGLDDDWQRWAMFLLSIKGHGDQAADLSLVIPPSAQQIIDGEPLEEILFARDEIANMVWGVERTITLPSGDAKRGREAAAETQSFYMRESAERLGQPPEPPPPALEAKIRYKVMSSVPENWIPMISVHVANDNRETQLQRAAMLRIIEGDPVKRPVEPCTSLLRVGLDETQQVGYFLHEEEVSRAGVQVTQRFRRTRGQDGRAWVWLGVRKRTGRGEGSSGLAFDQILDLPLIP